MKRHPLIIVSLFIMIFISCLSLVQCSHKTSGFQEDDDPIAGTRYREGKRIFRYETFGDEIFWTDKLQLHKAIADIKHGGNGPGLTPKAALDVGLKIDFVLLPGFLKKKIKDGKFLDDPSVTLELLKIDAIIGVMGKFDDSKNLVSVGITCASCHSTVQSPTGIGQRMDGWPNRDLNIGAIISMAPNLKPYADQLGMEETTVKKILASWGPGRYDALLNIDGKAFRPDGKTAATLIPEAFGHGGQNVQTWTGGWGHLTYWNAFEANLQLQGQGNFKDERLNNAGQYPLAAKNGSGNKSIKNDLIIDKLSALQYYQLSLGAPKPPGKSYNKEEAERGKIVFNGKAQCSTCHVSPLFTEPGKNTHKPEDICIDDFQSNRSPEKTYVTQGLQGLWAHTKGGFYHDGRFATYMDVINHYNECKKLDLTPDEKTDLVEYLKSL